MTTTKQGQQLTLRDRLSRLNFTEACKLLGEEGKQLIQQGGKWDIKIAEDVYLGDDLFRLKIDGAVVTITPMAGAKQRLHWHCDRCTTACIHAGAAFSLILEEKTALGLAAGPLFATTTFPESTPRSPLARFLQFYVVLAENAFGARSAE